MAYAVYQNITIADYQFSRSNGIEIRKGTNTIGATAVIKTPISAVIENEGDQSGQVEIAKAIAVGDAVSITLGYHTADDDYENEEFTGFVKRINPGIPLEIECEDNNYLLRKKTINKSWKSTTLSEVLNEIIADTDIVLDCNLEMPLSPYYINKKNGARALHDLAEEYPLTIYFKKDGSLYVGLHYTETSGKTGLVLNGNNTNVIDTSNLKFRNADDVKLKVKIINILDDNSRIIAEVGDEDGDLKTLHRHNNKLSKTDLESIAEKEMTSLKYDGYEGKLKCFLIPFVEPAYQVSISDSTYPDREGDYFVESVVVTCGMGGIRREIELGVKL